MSYQFDHRQLADEMKICVFDEQVGAGLPLWLPNGVAIREALEAFVKHREHLLGYQRVVCPHLGKKSLFEASGHLKSFGENMFPPMRGAVEQMDYYLKPMNCPHHHKVFSAMPRSYRDLPLRLAEYGQVYRYENSGSLRGLVRARGLCQNDAHIYINPSEALREVLQVLELHEYCYSALGLKGYRYRLSKHDPLKFNNYDGSLEEWIKCEEILRQALIEKGLPYFEAEGEAAFYGPKIDIQMRVGPSEEESVASIQLDFNSARKFNLQYVSSSGRYEQPWIIHRAPLGSHERFVSLLLEYYDGQLPGWLAPIQLYVLPVGEEGEKAARSFSDKLRDVGIRFQVDNHLGSLSKRILFSHKLRPFAKVILGQKEVLERSIVLQLRDREIKCDIDNVAEVLRQKISPP